jgi:hypothetical protein
MDGNPRLEAPATVIIGGDISIQAPGRTQRIGVDAAEDCAPTGDCDDVCGDGGADGYDVSLAALLTLVGARLLSMDLPETFIGQFFPGGAIDHILVAGPAAAISNGDRADRLRHRPPRRHQHVDLPQLRDNLLGLVLPQASVFSKANL